jgi:hypothetical protein
MGVLGKRRGGMGMREKRPRRIGMPPKSLPGRDPGFRLPPAAGSFVPHRSPGGCKVAESLSTGRGLKISISRSRGCPVIVSFFPPIVESLILFLRRFPFPA